MTPPEKISAAIKELISSVEATKKSGKCVDRSDLDSPTRFNFRHPNREGIRYAASAHHPKLPPDIC